MRLRWPCMRGSRMLQELHVPFDVVGQFRESDASKLDFRAEEIDLFVLVVQGL